jgi:hypothetical protein
MTTVSLRSHRRQRALFAQKLQHAAPVFMLLPDGLARLRASPHGESLLLGGAEVVVCVLVIGSIVRGFLQLRAKTPHAPPHAHGHDVDWVDVCLGAMLVVEAVMHQHETGHLPRPTLLVAVVMLALGLSHGRRTRLGDRRFTLRVTDEGLSVPGRFFTRTTYAWADIAAITMDEAEASIIGRNGGRHRIRFKDLVNPDPVRQALDEAARHLTPATPPLDTASPPLL